MLVVISIIYFVFMILDSGPFNGFVRIPLLKTIQLSPSVVLSLIEDISYLLFIILSFINIYQVTICPKLETSRQQKSWIII